MAAFEQIPLVGPGNELQLTLDGRAVPHLEVVGAGEAKPERVADEGAPPSERPGRSAGVQITL